MFSFQVKEAFRIISEDKNVKVRAQPRLIIFLIHLTYVNFFSLLKAILVNVFGGIVDCSIIANGVVNASNSLNLRIPLVVRLEGQNVEAAKKILKESGLDIMR